MKKKIFLVGIIAVILVSIAFVGVKKYNEHKNIQKQEAQQKLDKEAAVRPEQADIEDLIRNYRRIYANLANDKGFDLSFLDNVLDKNSAYYKSVTDDIQDKRKQGIKIESKNLEISKVDVDKDTFTVNVKEQVAYTGAKEATENLEGSYVIKKTSKSYKVENYIKK